MVQELIRAFLLIFVAEMGDKTQILAMAFATKFPVKKVMLGIGLGSLLNHGIAVLFGSLLSQFIPINTIQMIAGIAFLVFTLWSLKSDDFEEEDDEIRFNFGPTLTVAMAFFLGELGDKTQLTAITLAVDASYPLIILAGTVSGMIVTGVLGIFIGKIMGDKIPEIAIKLFAASVFMAFGIQKLFQTLPRQLLQVNYVMPFLLILLTLVTLMVNKLLIRRREGIQSDFNMKSKILHDYYEHIKDDLDSLVVHDQSIEDHPLIPVDKGQEVIINAQLEHIDMQFSKISHDDKHVPSAQIIDTLVDTLWVIDHVKDIRRLEHVHEVREKLECLLIGTSFKNYTSMEEYVKLINLYNPYFAKSIKIQHDIRRPIEERVINLGSLAHNMYLVHIQDGYMLIDTGAKNQYDLFRGQLSNHDIELNEIKYVFITHAHDDHVGFLNDILRDTQAKVILHEKAVEALKLGENPVVGGFSSILAQIQFKLKKAIKKKDHRFEPVTVEDRFIKLTPANKEKLEEKLNVKIMELPGHTHDSIGIIIEKKILFCGDAGSNMLPGSKVINWIESISDYKESWNKMIESDFDLLYPAHGKPFLKEELKRSLRKLDQVRIRQ